MMRTVTAMLFFVMMVLISGLTGTSLGQSGADCGAILRAGVYDEITRTSSSAFANTQQKALRTNFDSFSYEQYDSAKADKSSSEQAKQTAMSFEAAASYGPIGVEVGYSESDAQSSKTMQSNQFAEAKKKQSTLRKSMEENQSSTNTGSETASEISKLVNPKAYQAYESCLNLFKSGIRTTVTGGLDQTSMVVTLQFVSETAGATASLLGLDTSSEYASCNLKGLDLTPEMEQDFKIPKLVPNLVYSITCKLKPDTPRDGKSTDIYIQTAPGGTYRNALFHPRNVTYSSASAGTTVAACDKGRIILACTTGKLALTSAKYGGPNLGDEGAPPDEAAKYPNICPGTTANPPCQSGYASRLSLLKKLCEGKQNCFVFGTIAAYGGDLGDDPCAPNNKILYVEYSCI